MSVLRPILLICSILLSIPQTHAVTIFECVDAKGNKSFMDRCPTGTTQVNKREIQGKKKAKAIDLTDLIAETPVILYRIADCDACDLVDTYLKNRSIPFTQQDASEDIEVQTTLKELAGNLTVPFVTVGSKSITGYNKQQMDSILSAAGYPTKKAPPAETDSE